MNAQDAPMTSLVIVEAERGVTHLMLILDLDGANEAKILKERFLHI